MYDCIHAVLMDPTNTTYGTPQFRFWVRKIFVLARFQSEYTVTHEDKPVAVKEQIYQILVHCHGECYHGRRDKTCAQIKGYYSWIPKELVAQFVKACPTCVLKRSNNPKKFVAMLKDISGSHQGTEEQYIDFITSPLRNRGGPSPRGSAGSSRSSDNAAAAAAPATASASKPNPRFFAHPARPLLSYLRPLSSNILSCNWPDPTCPMPPHLPSSPPVRSKKPNPRSATPLDRPPPSALSLLSFPTPGWASGGSSTPAAGGGAFHHHHLGVPGAVEMNRGLARSAAGDFGHPHASGAAAAAWAMHGLVAPHGYLPASAGMAPSTSAPPFHPSSSATAFHSSSFNPFHVAADPNAASLYAQSTATAQAQDQQE
ncbi:carbohydrate-binding module family 1 protein, partial [Tulasnella calospora MUT 4182]